MKEHLLISLLRSTAGQKHTMTYPYVTLHIKIGNFHKRLFNCPRENNDQAKHPDEGSSEIEDIRQDYASG